MGPQAKEIILRFFMSDIKKHLEWRKEGQCSFED